MTIKKVLQPRLQEEDDDLSNTIAEHFSNKRKRHADDSDASDESSYDGSYYAQTSRGPRSAKSFSTSGFSTSSLFQENNDRDNDMVSML